MDAGSGVDLPKKSSEPAAEKTSPKPPESKPATPEVKSDKPAAPPKKRVRPKKKPAATAPGAKPKLSKGKQPRKATQPTAKKTAPQGKASRSEETKKSWLAAIFTWRGAAAAVTSTWGASLLFHSGLLFSFGLYHFGQEGLSASVDSLTSSFTEEDPAEEPIEIVEEEIEMEQASEEENAEETLVPDIEVSALDVPLMEDLSDIAAPPEMVEDLVGGLSGPEAPGLEFFGVKAKANKVAFVVDNSNSMQNGRFETAVIELQKSINKLGPKQEFYIVFYSDTAYGLFHPTPAKEMVPATPANKKKVELWLRTVHRCLRTDGIEAFRVAAALKPDVIYVLGDGAFTDKTVEVLMKTKPGKAKFHTLGFSLKEGSKGHQTFVAIADRFGGKYTPVKVSPEMVKLAKQVNRPKNNKRNGVWGLKLGMKK